jgi:hypothetical protein
MYLMRVQLSCRLPWQSGLLLEVLEGQSEVCGGSVGAGASSAGVLIVMRQMWHEGKPVFLVELGGVRVWIPATEP